MLMAVFTLRECMLTAIDIAIKFHIKYYYLYLNNLIVFFDIKASSSQKGMLSINYARVELTS